MTEHRETHTALVHQIAEKTGLPATVIEHALIHDEAFREMWEEFERCHEMESQWRGTLPRHLDRINEYATLSREVKEEIELYLEQHRDVESSD